MTAETLLMPSRDALQIYQTIEIPLLAHCHEQELDIAIVNRLQSVYIPLSHWIYQQHGASPVVIGINGALGAGKTTLTRLLGVILRHGFDKRMLHLSLDDLYYSKEKRLQLAKEIHPLFRTRGVPGTHDVEAGIRILEQCLAGSDEMLRIPKFNKANDDREPENQWKVVQHPVDIILFEGWCVGAVPQTDEALINPVNQLEAEEDSQSIWRNYVNQQLKHDYQRLFRMIDRLIMLKVPSMLQVSTWRAQQEKALSNNARRANALMSKEEIERFILHDERLIQHQLNEMPERADMVLEIGEDHQISDMYINRAASGFLA